MTRLHLPIGYDTARLAGRNSLDSLTAPGSEGKDVEIAVGSFLFWIVALDDRVRELNRNEYSALATRHAGSTLMPGLKLARNALAHGVVPVSLPGGLTVPMTIPLVIHPVRWTSLSHLKEGWTPVATPHLSLQIGVYEEHLAERSTIPALQSTFDWVASFSPRAESQS